MTTLDLDELERLEKLEKAATKGPWRSERHGCYGDVVRDYEDGVATGFRSTMSRRNAALVAAMRNALPELIAAARERATLEEALRPFAEVGQWLFARPLPDDDPVVELPGLNGYSIVLSRGHFKTAHLAINAPTGAALSPTQNKPAETVCPHMCEYAADSGAIWRCVICGKEDAQ